MKKIIVLASTLILVACGENKITDLKINVDKPADVEKKFGKPDSIARKVFMGMSAEFWAYRNDSICLLFKDDILTQVEEHCFSGFSPTQNEIQEIEAAANRMGDSIAKALESTLK